MPKCSMFRLKIIEIRKGNRYLILGISKIRANHCLFHSLNTIYNKKQALHNATGRHNKFRLDGECVLSGSVL